ncbi:MAG TPA: class F sortase, partial [Candidatus Saccharimonadales bacterium]
MTASAYVYYWSRLHLRRLAIQVPIALVLYKHYIASINIKALLSERLFVYRLSRMFLMMGIAFMLIGVVSSVNVWQANASANSRASKLVAVANKRDSTNKPAPAQPNNAAVPSTVKPNTPNINAYQVPADQPRYMIIPKLGVDARVLSVGLNSSGAINTPSNVFDTAWYNQSAIPGAPGATLIDGHISSWTSHGVFYSLSSLSSGDIVQIELGDGSILSYRAINRVAYDVNNVDMNAVLSPAVANTSGLNLITCGGSVIPGTNEFNQRTVVFTEL